MRRAWILMLSISFAVYLACYYLGRAEYKEQRRTIPLSGLLFLPSALPLEPHGQLRDACRAPRIASGQDSVVADIGRVVGVVQDVEEIDVEPQGQSFGELRELE